MAQAYRTAVEQGGSRRRSTPAPRSSPACVPPSRGSLHADRRPPGLGAAGARGFSLVQDPYSEAEVYAIPALMPDVALIHVQEADAEGNGRIIGPASRMC
jgi:acyl CoA:acetate/3-ketoacid CoA transferase alpha subunit